MEVSTHAEEAVINQRGMSFATAMYTDRAQITILPYFFAERGLFFHFSIEKIWY